MLTRACIKLEPTGDRTAGNRFWFGFFLRGHFWSGFRFRLHHWRGCGFGHGLGDGFYLNGRLGFRRWLRLGCWQSCRPWRVCSHRSGFGRGWRFFGSSDRRDYRRRDGDLFGGGWSCRIWRQYVCRFRVDTFISCCCRLATVHGRAARRQHEHQCRHAPCDSPHRNIPWLVEFPGIAASFATPDEASAPCTGGRFEVVT